MTGLMYEEDTLNLYMLDYENEDYGASLILIKKSEKLFGSNLGRNYFVMPSSIHEVMIAPDYDILDPEDFFKIVRDCNASRAIVKESDILSYEVQWCTETGLSLTPGQKKNFKCYENGK